MGGSSSAGHAGFIKGKRPLRKPGTRKKWDKVNELLRGSCAYWHYCFILVADKRWSPDIHKKRVSCLIPAFNARDGTFGTQPTCVHYQNLTDERGEKTKRPYV